MQLSTARSILKKVAIKCMLKYDLSTRHQRFDPLTFVCNAVYSFWEGQGFCDKNIKNNFTMFMMVHIECMYNR